MEWQAINGMCHQRCSLLRSKPLQSLGGIAKALVKFQAGFMARYGPYDVAQLLVGNTLAPPCRLTEWGIIIFCILLFGWMAWVVVRRRKTVSVKM